MTVVKLPYQYHEAIQISVCYKRDECSRVETCTSVDNLPQVAL